MLVENELKKLKTFDLSYFGGKNYFDGSDGAQNVLYPPPQKKCGPTINIYIVYKTTPKTISSSLALKNCLFGAVKITNAKWQVAI